METNNAKKGNSFFPTENEARETIGNLKKQKKWEQIAILMVYYDFAIKDSALELKRDERTVVHGEMSHLKSLSKEKLKNRFLGISEQTAEVPKPEAALAQTENVLERKGLNPKPKPGGKKKRLPATYS